MSRDNEYWVRSHLETAITMQEYVSTFYTAACLAIERGELSHALVFQRKAAEAHEFARRNMEAANGQQVD